MVLQSEKQKKKKKREKGEKKTLFPFPFFLASFSPVGQQKFPDFPVEVSGALCPPAPRLLCHWAYGPLCFSLVSKRYMTLPSNKIVSSWESNWKVQKNIDVKLCKIDLPVITVPNLSSYMHMHYHPEVTPYFFLKYYCAPFLPILISIRKKSFLVSEMLCWISGFFFFFFLKCRNISDIAACNIPTLAQKQLFNSSQLANMKKCIPYMSLP